jgi:class 3 adenylate cyclase/tetratricopeptide (TPR) repeat protein
MICPKCRRPSPSDFAFCPRCGTALECICADCGSPVPAGAAFCPGCAAALTGQAAAPRGILANGAPAPAGRPVRPGQHSDSGAGAEARLAALERLVPREYMEQLLATRDAPRQPERRLITILFCDVVDSVAIEKHLDPEEVLEVMNGAFEALIPPVFHHQGTLARLMGDAILAFFGAPVAHEDDPVRAVRAALEMVDNARLYGAQLSKERGIEGFAVRAGINTGLVVVGEVGIDLRVEYTAMGDAVNLAARLQAVAPPGAILITHDTYRQVRGRFDVVPQAPLTIRGHSDPVQCYLVQRAKPHAFPIGNRGVEGIATRMVGREAELAALQQAYLDATDGHQARVVTVLGEAGIGKSRLLDEFVSWVELRPERVDYWKARAARVTQGMPYGLLRNLFARRFGILDSDSAAVALSRFRQGMAGILEEEQADLAGHLAGFDFSASPAVRALLGSPSFGQIASASLRQGLQALWRLGQPAALCIGHGEGAPHEYPRGPGSNEQEEPALLLLEDVHWADDASLDLIAGLVAEAPRARLLVLAAARPQLLERRPNWGEGLEAYVRLELRPLSRRGGRALVGEILQRAAEVPEELCEMLVEGSEGNPFFLEELVKMLIEDGTIEPGTEQWSIDGQRLGHVRLPPTLTAVLQARLDALPPDERVVLQRASVIGRQFWDNLVAELAPERMQVGALLAALRSRELVFQRERPAFGGVQEYTFKHSFLHEVTYETVLLHVRRTCHAQVARWLEEHAAERLGEYLALIAEHYRLAGEGAVAADWYVRAGERAAALGETSDARGFFGSALELLPPDDLELRWRALAGQDEVLGVLGDSEARQAADQALLELAEQMGGDHRLAEAQYRRGHYLGVLSRYPEAVEALDASLAAAARASDRHVRAKTLPLKVFTLTRMGQMVDAGAIAGEALACAEMPGEPEILARALSNVSIYYAAAGDLSRAAQLVARQADILQQVGNLVGQAISLCNLGYYYLLLGLYPKARTALEEALALSQAIGARREQLYNQLNLGLACWRTGDGQTARRLLEDVIPELEALGDTFGRASGQNYLALVLEQLGNVVAAAEAFEQARASFDEIGARGCAADALAGLTRCRMVLGDLAAVRESAEALWHCLHEGTGGMELPLLAYDTCARAFEMVGEADLASVAVGVGHAVLMDQASKISDPEWRQSYLEGIPEHRALVERQAAAHHTTAR